MDTMTLINGNHQPYTIGLPKIVILTKEINDTALAHITENTGLHFERTGWGYEAQPETALQLAALFMTYNFKTRHYNNADFKNTLMLKFDHHVGFDVDSICVDCCKHNYINTNGLEPDDRLAC